MTLHHRVDGPNDAPPLILGPSLGTSLAVWDPQIRGLARTHRVIRWVLPGHGQSPAELMSSSEQSPATIADLGRLVLNLADSLGISRFDYAGISLGGAVGLWLAVHHPERIASLALICSSARFGDPQLWRDRAALVRAEGNTDSIADTADTRWFTPEFRSKPASTAMVAALRSIAPEGYAACCDVLAGYDLRADLDRITTPTMVIAGREDPATPVAHSRELVDGIPGASLIEVAHAAHLANVEQPGPVLAALLTHLAPEPSTGEAVRRAVLGDDHVDRAIARTTEFTAVFQDFITRYAWGEIWTRPGLSRQMRSAITLTALTAGGHHEELALHVRAALRNGLTPQEIQEVLLQSAVYCGVPAANAAFAIADKILQEEGL